MFYNVLTLFLSENGFALRVLSTIMVASFFFKKKKKSSIASQIISVKTLQRMNGAAEQHASWTQLSHQCHGFLESRDWFVPPGVGDKHKELWKWKADSMCAKAAFDQRLAGAQKASRKWDQKVFVCVFVYHFWAQLTVAFCLSDPDLFLPRHSRLITGCFEREAFGVEPLLPLNEQIQMNKCFSDQTDIELCVWLPVNSI